MSAPDFNLKAGNNHVIQMTITDATTGDPLDLTSADYIKFRVASSVVASPPWVIEKSVGDGLTVVNPATTGVIQVAIVPADTIDLAGTFYYEIEVKESGLDISTVKQGRLKVNKTLLRTADVT